MQLPIHIDEPTATLLDHILDTTLLMTRTQAFLAALELLGKVVDSHYNGKPIVQINPTRQYSNGFVSFPLRDLQLFEDHQKEPNS